MNHFVYEKDDNAPKAFLNFEGGDCCYYVWLNGHYIGYSQVSHATAEFDVTEYLVNLKSISLTRMNFCLSSHWYRL